MHLSYTNDSALCRLFLSRHDIIQHSVRTGEITLALGRELGLSNTDLFELLLTACLHDVGKAAVPHFILDKPGPLTSNEWAQIKLHPILGHSLIQAVPAFCSVAPGILYHHERWDGKGYPHGVRATDIPVAARIISIADAFDAMTTCRPYRQPLSAEQAISELIKEAGKQFDPDLARTSVNVVRRLPHSLNRLSAVEVQLEQVAVVVVESTGWTAVTDASRRDQLIALA